MATWMKFLPRLAFVVLLACATSYGANSTVGGDQDHSTDTLLQIPSVSANDIMKEMTIMALGFVPVVGGLLSGVVSLMWPSSGSSHPQFVLDYENLWEKLVPDIQNLIDSSILEQKTEDLQSDLQTIHEALGLYEVYLDGEDYDQARTYLSKAETECISVMNRLDDVDEDRLHLLSVSLPTVILHLTILREFHERGHLLSDTADQTLWEDRLSDLVNEYSALLSVTFQEWREYRISLIVEPEFGDPNHIFVDIYSSTQQVYDTHLDFQVFNESYRISQCPILSPCEVRDDILRRKEAAVESYIANLTSTMEAEVSGARHLLSSFFIRESRAMLAQDGCSLSNSVSVAPMCLIEGGVAAIRCCSMDDSSCTSYCTDENEFYNGGPQPTNTVVEYQEAFNFCEAHGQRLCLPAELDRCCGTDCGNDDRVTWTSQPCTTDHEIRQFACEAGSQTILAELVCPTGYSIELLSVFYGARASGNPCGAPVEETCSLGSEAYEVVSSQCAGASSCAVLVTNANLGGDPCPGVGKRFEASYMCVA